MSNLKITDLVADLAKSPNRWQARETAVSQLPEDQQKALLGVIVNTAELAAVMKPTAGAAPVANYAPEVDWRNHNGNHITPVKDQGGCGSCVSFCTTSVTRTIGTTTILVTHDQNEAMSLSDRIVVMSQGKIEQIGTPQETYEKPASTFVSQFLGKTNDFAGTIDRTAAPVRIVAGSWSALAPAGLNGAVTVSIRPERIGFGDAGLNARIVTRIFQGNHWLFQCDSECGPAIVIRQNDGTAQPAEGEAVRLTWRPEDMSVRARAGA